MWSMLAGCKKKDNIMKRNYKKKDVSFVEYLALSRRFKEIGHVIKLVIN